MISDNTGRTPGGITKTPLVLCPPAGAASLVGESRRLVCLVRHGQTDWNTVRRLQGREAVPLNETGCEQSKRCGELFRAACGAGFAADAFFTSPLGRASDTAKYITDALGAGDAVTEDLLIERDYGALSGLTTEERREVYKNGGPDPEAETVEDAAARMKRALVKISSCEGRGAVVAVTHGGVINALFSCITGGRIGTGKNFSENCGISLVAVGRDATIPLAYGLVGDIFLDYTERYAASRRKMLMKQ